MQTVMQVITQAAIETATVAVRAMTELAESAAYSISWNAAGSKHKACQPQLNESAEEWMGQFRIKVNECKYQECSRQLKEQFIKDINDKAMTSKIIKEFTEIKDTKQNDK